MGDEFSGEDVQEDVTPTSEDDAVEGSEQTGEPNEVRGLKDALVAERRKRQDLERRVNDAEVRAEEAYKKTLLYDNLIEQSRQAAQGPAYDPGDIPTFADVEKMNQQALRRVEETVRDREVQMMVAQERRDHADWDEKFEIAKRVAADNPGLDAVIMNAKNPAKVAYLVGKAHSLTGKEGEKAAQELKRTVDKNLQSQSTLGKVGSGGQVQKNEKLPEPGTKEFQALITKVKGY